MVTDLMMPGMDGQELLKAARAIRPDVEVVLMTAYGTVETAVAAMKDGAYDFITKPLKRHALVKAVQKALEKQALVAENTSLKAKLAEIGASGGRAMVGQSPAFRAMHGHHPPGGAVHRHGAARWASPAPARSWPPARSTSTPPRAKRPFIAVNCARPPGEHPGGGALRRGARRVHRRRGPARGPLRARPRRHPLPGRGGRDAPRPRR